MEIWGRLNRYQQLVIFRHFQCKFMIFLRIKLLHNILGGIYGIWTALARNIVFSLYLVYRIE